MCFYFFEHNDVAKPAVGRDIISIVSIVDLKSTQGIFNSEVGITKDQAEKLGGIK
jgi:hypothetical protein